MSSSELSILLLDSFCSNGTKHCDIALDDDIVSNKSDNSGANTRMMMHNFRFPQQREGGEEREPDAHRYKDTVDAQDDDAGGRGGWRNQTKGRDISRSCRRAGGERGKKTEKYIYIFAVLPHLESTPLGRVEHQEAFEEVLAICGHVERDAVLSSENALPQLLQGEGAGS